MSNALFADISGWQPPADKINWPAYCAWSQAGDGIARILIKASEGVGFKDENFEGYWANAVNAGIGMIGIYHYARADLNPGTAGAVKEAQWFASVVGKRLRPNDRLMLDFEQNESASWAIIFLDTLRSLLPRTVKPVLYDSLSHFVQFFSGNGVLPTICEAALAAWHPLSQGAPTLPNPDWKVAWWQFADNFNVPGIGTRIDANVWLGGPPVVEKDWKKEQAQDVWSSTPHTVGTGIYAAWLEAYERGIVCGLPISAEIHTVDWSGNAIVRQEFSHGWIEYYVAAAPEHPAGSHHGYTMAGATLVKLW